jgi:hypothetical protein
MDDPLEIIAELDCVEAEDAEQKTDRRERRNRKPAQPPHRNPAVYRNRKKQ